jgi:hypothetical protein
VSCMGRMVEMELQAMVEGELHGMVECEFLEMVEGELQGMVECELHGMDGRR